MLDGSTISTSTALDWAIVLLGAVSTILLALLAWNGNKFASHLEKQGGNINLMLVTVSSQQEQLKSLFKTSERHERSIDELERFNYHPSHSRR